MTPKQKAEELIEKIIKEGQADGFTKRDIYLAREDAKRFALIGANEVVKIHIEYHPPLVSDYWKKVITELEKIA